MNECGEFVWTKAHIQEQDCIILSLGKDDGQSCTFDHHGSQRGLCFVLIRPPVLEDGVLQA